MATVEKKATALVVGDVIVAKQSGSHFKIISMCMGALPPCPYLNLEDDEGKIREHDTSMDSRWATYTVLAQEQI